MNTKSDLGLDQYLKYLLILKRHWKASSTVFGLVVLTFTLAGFLQKRIYVAEGTMLFKKVSLTTSITGLGKESSDLEPLVQQESPLDTEREVMLSSPILQKIITKLNLKDEQGNPLNIEKFLKMVEVAKPKGGGDVLKVSFKSRDPKTAAAVANMLMNVYLENNINFNQAETLAVRKFIEQELPKAEVEVTRSTQMLRKFKEKYEVVALDEEARSAVGMISDLQKQIDTPQAEIADINAQYDRILQKLHMNSQDAINITTLSQSPSVQEVLTKLQQSETQLAIEKTHLAEQHPTIINLKKEVEALKNKLQERITKVSRERHLTIQGNLQFGQLQQDLTKQLVQLDITRQGLTNKIATLSKIQNSYKQRLRIVPRLEQEQHKLNNKIEVAQNTYLQLLKKLQEIRIAENQRVGNARIISPAMIPEKPMSSRKVLFIVAGVILGSLLSLLTAQILEAKKNSVEIEESNRANTSKFC